MHRSGRPRTRIGAGSNIRRHRVRPRIHSLQGFLGPSRRQEPAGNPGGDRGLLPAAFVNLVDEGIDIALGVGNTWPATATFASKPWIFERSGLPVAARRLRSKPTSCTFWNDTSR